MVEERPTYPLRNRDFSANLSLADEFSEKPLDFSVIGFQNVDCADI
jgi:hypothetical protein